jgi:phytoene dehydrogenase-like protein
MTLKKPEIVIIGGGHNGLVTAAYLAKAGKKVLVLEARPEMGGLAVTEEIIPGFQVDTAMHTAATLRPRIVRELFLKMHDFAFVSPTALSFLPLPDGQGLTIWPDPLHTVDEIRAFSTADADRFLDYCQETERFARFLERALSMVPPDPAQPAGKDLLGWVGVAAAFRAMGAEMYDLLRALPMSVWEAMDDWFTHPAVRASLAAPSLIGIQQGPRSGGTNFLLLYQHLGHRSPAGRPHPCILRGGMGQLSSALAASAYQFGADQRTNARVTSIKLSNGRATGVVLENGEEIDAPIVVSSATPAHTFTDLVDPYELPVTFNRYIANIRYRSATAKVNLALDTLPQFSALPAGTASTPDPRLTGRIQIGPSIPYLEKAYDAAKYDQFSDQPFLDMIMPTLHDPRLAPAGKHTLSILVQYVPYEWAVQAGDAAREQIGDRVIDTLAAYIPNIKDIILARQVLTPVDLETRFGLTGGNLYHGEMMLDQLFFMRPVPGYARYRTPIAGLYLCGSGCHPGGGITGEPGRLAAQTILNDLKANLV